MVYRFGFASPWALHPWELLPTLLLLRPLKNSRQFADKYCW